MRRYPPHTTQTSLRSFRPEFPANCGFYPAKRASHPAIAGFSGSRSQGLAGASAALTNARSEALAEPLVGCREGPAATSGADLDADAERPSRQLAARPPATATRSASPRTAPPRECCARPREWRCTLGFTAAPLAGLIVRTLKGRSLNCRCSRRCGRCGSKSRPSRGRLRQGSRGSIVANKCSVISPVADFPPRWQQGLDRTRNTLKRVGRPSGQTRERGLGDPRPSRCPPSRPQSRQARCPSTASGLRSASPNPSGTG